VEGVGKREAAIEDRLRCVSPRTAAVAVLGSTITACVAVLEKETDANGVVDAAAAAAMVSFVEGRSMVGQFCSGGGCLLVLRHCVGY
jgi:hypothetical protein